MADTSVLLQCVSEVYGALPTAKEPHVKSRLPSLIQYKGFQAKSDFAVCDWMTAAKCHRQELLSFNVRYDITKALQCHVYRSQLCARLLLDSLFNGLVYVDSRWKVVIKTIRDLGEGLFLVYVFTDNPELN